MNTFPRSAVVRISWIVLICIIIPAALPSPSFGELIPAERLTDWSVGIRVGVPGGIDQFKPGGAKQRTRLIDVSQAPYNADKTGSSDASSAINTAILAAAPGTVVHLPRGTYRLDRSIVVPHQRDGITVRGDGPDQTVLDSWQITGPVIRVGSDSSYLWNYPDVDVTGSPVKGATVLPVATTSALSEYPNGGIGCIARLSVTNDPKLPVIALGGWERSRSFRTRIVAKTETSVTVDPPIPFDLPQHLAPRLAVASEQSEWVGVENLTIDGKNSSTPHALLQFSQSFACWANNIALKRTPNYLLGLGDSVQCEIRECDLRERKTQGTNGAGILLGGVSNCLIEDNIVWKIFPHLEVNYSCTANVVAYNYFEWNDVFGIMGASIDSNHGAHNSGNLYEGNVASKFQCDGYFGSASEDTLFRNWLHGSSDTTNLFGVCINLNRFTRNYSIVGNVLGRPGFYYIYDNGEGGISYAEKYIYALGLPNMGNGGYAGKVKPSANSWWSVWSGERMVRTGAYDPSKLYTHTHEVRDVVDYVADGHLNWIASNPMKNGQSGWKTPGLQSGDWRPIDAGSFQELDLDVRETTVRKGNYNYATNSIPAAESTGGAELPASLFRNAKPRFFGNLEWPPFDPERPTAISYDRIPAGYRYLHGKKPPADDIVPSAPVNLRIKGSK